MNKNFLKLVQTLRATFFGNAPNRGSTSAELRSAIECHVVSLNDPLQQAPDDTLDIPDNLTGYVQKVALHAHKITDMDMTALKDVGYSEDELFEITISAALGAGRIRLEAGLTALVDEEESFLDPNGNEKKYGESTHATIYSR